MTDPDYEGEDDVTRLLGLINANPDLLLRLVRSREDATAALQEHGFEVTPARLDALMRIGATNVEDAYRAFGPPGFVVN